MKRISLIEPHNRIHFYFQDTALLLPASDGSSCIQYSAYDLWHQAATVSSHFGFPNENKRCLFAAAFCRACRCINSATQLMAYHVSTLHAIILRYTTIDPLTLK